MLEIKEGFPEEVAFKFWRLRRHQVEQRGRGKIWTSEWMQKGERSKSERSYWGWQGVRPQRSYLLHSGIWSLLWRILSRVSWLDLCFRKIIVEGIWKADSLGKEWRWGRGGLERPQKYDSGRAFRMPGAWWQGGQSCRLSLRCWHGQQGGWRVPFINRKMKEEEQVRPEKWWVEFR